jgi:hypothetical protein
LSIGHRALAQTGRASTLFIIIHHWWNKEQARLEKDMANCHMTGADEDPVSGLRAACTKLIKTNFASPIRFLNLTTTLATRDVFNPVIPLLASATRPSRRIRKRLFDFI